MLLLMSSFVVRFVLQYLGILGEYGACYVPGKLERLQNWACRSVLIPVGDEREQGGAYRLSAVAD